MNAIWMTTGFMEFIPNKNLQLKDIPESASTSFDWFDFAHTINGYEVMGGFTGCADLAHAAVQQHSRSCVVHCSLRLGVIAIAEASPPMRLTSLSCC